MQNDLDKKRAKVLIETGLGLMKDFDEMFVAYNTVFLGESHNDSFVIDGEDTSFSKSRKEFCYGYDLRYHQLQLLHVRETKSGKKFAIAEISMSVFAFWRVF